MFKMNNQEYQQSIERYSVAMLFAKKMLESSIISNEDYNKIEDKIAQKYCIKIDSIYRLNDLINSTLSGNMSH